MGSKFASGNKAIAYCDVCGWRFKLKELRSLIVKNRDTNIKACIECWNEGQPQLRLGDFPVDDPQALRNPRPDQSLGDSGNTSSRDIYWGWNPVGGGNSPYDLTPNTLQAVGSVGQVTVTTT
tara:strand:+ start:578 stop:943 length:366 start_codon:yes stop_codon:yes gene_type:complete